MSLHQTTGRWRYGLFLTLITCVMWTVLPLFLKRLIREIDPITVTWFRFSMCAVLMWGILARTGSLPARRHFTSSNVRLLVLAGLGLYTNNILFLHGLDRVTAGAAQILIQAGPAFLLLGSLVVFREPFTKMQWIGFVVLTVGMLLFFNRQVEELFGGLGSYTIGALLILLAALLWAGYSLAQKQLLRTFSTGQVLFMLCVGAVFFYAPAIRPAQIVNLSLADFLIMVFCGVNLILAYGSFGEALRHWEASRISAMLSLIPLMTLGLLEICERWLPALGRSENLNPLGWIGAALVVVGSMQCALPRGKATAPAND